MGPIFLSCCDKQNCMCSGCVEINGERKGRFVWTCTVDLIDFKAPVSLARHVVNSEPSGENGFSLPHNNHRCASVGSSNFEIHTVTKTWCSDCSYRIVICLLNYRHWTLLSTLRLRHDTNLTALFIYVCIYSFLVFVLISLSPSVPFSSILSVEWELLPAVLYCVVTVVTVCITISLHQGRRVCLSLAVEYKL